MTPLITIGIPCFNRAATLRRAVESVRQQSVTDLRIEISDNASTDGSAAIADAIAASDDRVTVLRQPRNLGALGNYRFLLMRTETPYFMWLAADDYLKFGFLAQTLAMLERDPTLVTCVSRVTLIQPDGIERDALGTYPLQGDVSSNHATYLANLDDNARFYGLHRTAIMQQVFPSWEARGAWDYQPVAETLLHGGHAEVPEFLMVREETPADASRGMVLRAARGWHERMLPLLPTTLHLLFRARIPVRPSILGALALFNLKMHYYCATKSHPRYARFLDRHVMWRFPHIHSRRRHAAD
jgi:glycosyltransferase involved in cell wall biosynthesis